MELNFKISAAQLDTLAENNKTKRMAKSALQGEWLHAYIECSLLLWLPLLLSAIVPYFFFGKNSLESGITSAASAAIYYIAWSFYLKDFLTTAPSKCALPISAIEQAMETSIRHRMTALEGSYQALISPKTLTLTTPSKKIITIAWSKISRLRQDNEFYYLSTRFQAILDNAYLIAKHSNEMDSITYQANIDYMLSCIKDHKNQPRPTASLIDDN